MEERHVFLQVHFILSGNNDETSVRTLSGGSRPILDRGHSDSFIISVPRWAPLLHLTKTTVSLVVDHSVNWITCVSGMITRGRAPTHLGFSSISSCVICRRWKSVTSSVNNGWPWRKKPAKWVNRDVDIPVEDARRLDRSYIACGQCRRNQRIETYALEKCLSVDGR